MAMADTLHRHGVTEVIELLAAAVDELDVEVVSGADAVRLTEVFARGERLCQAGKAMAARRATHCGQWSRQGCRSPEEWLAGVSGTSLGPARDALDVAEQMVVQPALEAAVKGGDLSAAQAAHIAGATAVDPSAGDRLVERARTGTFKRLKDACQATRLSAQGAEDDRTRYARLHRSRYLRTWTGRDGAGRLDARLAPDRLAAVLACLKPFEDRAFDEARQAGQRERAECYAADALVAMAEAATGAPGPPPATVIAVVDHAALVRGHARAEETCVVAGVGPVPVSTVRDMMTDAFLAAVVKDGVDIRSVAHAGRHVTAHQRTALMVRDPECAVPGCAVRKGLETDHVDGWAATHRTQLDHLARLCHHHHYLKTYEGWRLTGRPGAWEWHPPPGGGLDDPSDRSP